MRRLFRQNHETGDVSDQVKLICQFQRGQKHRSASERHEEEDKAEKASEEQPLFFRSMAVS